MYLISINAPICFLSHGFGLDILFTWIWFGLPVHIDLVWKLFPIEYHTDRPLHFIL